MSMSTQKADQLTALIEKSNGELSEQRSQRAQLLEEIAQLEKDIETAKTERAAEHEKYQAEMADIEGAIHDLKLAIETLEETKAGQEGSVALHLDQLHKRVQHVAESLKWARLNEKAEEMRAALSQVKEEPHGYQYHSNGIMATLDKLKDEYLDLKNTTYYAEFERQKAHDQHVLDLTIQIRTKNQAAEELAKAMAALDAQIQDAVAQQEKEIRDRNRYTEALASLTEDCQNKAKKYDETKAYNAAEQQALVKAEDMLVKNGLQAEQGVAAAGAFLQEKPKKAISFLQLNTDNDLNANSAAKQMAAQAQALMVLSNAAHKLKSSNLLVTLYKARVSKDHFVKVRDLIKDMVSRLEDDAREEANQKIACDWGMRKSTKLRDSANANIEDQSGTITQKSAERKNLKAENAQKSKDISDQTNARDELAKLHKETRDNMVATKVAADIGKSSIQFAMQTLRQVFNDGTSFIQASEGHKARAKVANNILSNLEVISASFQRTIDENDASIQQEDREFERDDEELKDGIEDLNDTYKSNENRIATLNAELTDAEEALDEAQDQKASALATLEKLKRQCVDSSETFEQRQAKAKAELESLKEAYQILDSWNE